MQSLQNAERQLRAPPTDMFEDVYVVLPKHLIKQRQDMIDHLKMYQDEYPTDLYEKIPKN